jgi:hypothetical protein
MVSKMYEVLDISKSGLHHEDPFSYTPRGGHIFDIPF